MGDVAEGPAVQGQWLPLQGPPSKASQSAQVGVGGVLCVCVLCVCAFVCVYACVCVLCACVCVLCVCACVRAHNQGYS